MGRPLTLIPKFRRHARQEGAAARQRAIVPEICPEIERLNRLNFKS